MNRKVLLNIEVNKSITMLLIILCVFFLNLNKLIANTDNGGACKFDFETSLNYLDSSIHYELLNSFKCYQFSIKILELNKRVTCLDPQHLVEWDKMIMKAHYFVACYHGLKRVKNKMFFHYKLAYSKAKQHNDVDYIAKIGANLGAETIIEGVDYFEGQRLLEEANKAAHLSGDKSLLIKTQRGFAFFFLLIEEYQKSLEYSRKNELLLKNMEVDYSELTYISIGSTFIKMGHPDSAVFYLSSYLRNYEKQNLISITASLKTFLAGALIQLEKPKEAMEHLRSALAIFKEYDNLVWPETYYFYGQAHAIAGQLDSSEYYLKLAVDQAIRVTSKKVLSDCYAELAKVQKENKKVKDAYKSLENHLIIARENGFYSLKAQMLRHNLVFENEKKIHLDSITRARLITQSNEELELKDLDLKNKSKIKLLALAVALFSLFLLGFVAFVTVRVIKKRKLIKQLKKRSERQLRVVENQKTKLKIQQRDIEDSVNYTEGILKSVLPTNKIKKYCGDKAAILYGSSKELNNHFYYFIEKNGIKMFAYLSSDVKGVSGVLNNLLVSNEISRIIKNEYSNNLGQLYKQVSLFINNKLNEIFVQNSFKIGLMSIDQNGKVLFVSPDVNLAISSNKKGVQVMSSSEVVEFTVNSGDFVILGDKPSFEWLIEKLGEEIQFNSYEDIKDLKKTPINESICLISYRL